MYEFKINSRFLRYMRTCLLLYTIGLALSSQVYATGTKALHKVSTSHGNALFNSNINYHWRAYHKP